MVKIKKKKYKFQPYLCVPILSSFQKYTVLLGLNSYISFSHNPRWMSPQESQWWKGSAHSVVPAVRSRSLGLPTPHPSLSAMSYSLLQPTRCVWSVNTLLYKTLHYIMCSVLPHIWHIWGSSQLLCGLKSPVLVNLGLVDCWPTSMIWPYC